MCLKHHKYPSFSLSEVNYLLQSASGYPVFVYFRFYFLQLVVKHPVYIISAVVLFCFDKFEENQTRNFSTFFLNVIVN